MHRFLLLWCSVCFIAGDQIMWVLFPGWISNAHPRRANLGFKNVAKPSRNLFWWLRIKLKRHSWMLLWGYKLFIPTDLSSIDLPKSFKSISSNLNFLFIISYLAHINVAIAWYWRCNCEMRSVISCTKCASFSTLTCIAVIVYSNTKLKYASTEWII